MHIILYVVMLHLIYLLSDIMTIFKNDMDTPGHFLILIEFFLWSFDLLHKITNIFINNSVSIVISRKTC